MAAATLGRAVLPPGLCSAREFAERPQPTCLPSPYLSQIHGQRLATSSLSSSSTHSLQRLPEHSTLHSCSGHRTAPRLRVRASTTLAAAAHAQAPAKLAVFVSGGGSNFRTIHAGIKEGRINGEVVAVVSDKPECGGSEYAREHGLPVLAYPQSAKFAPDGLGPKDLVAQLQAAGVEFVLLAGYLKLLPEELCAAYPRAILNIHPALLPAFGGKGYYGMKVHEAVIRSGARVSGPTIHFVDEEFDHGPIVAQSVVPVYHTDTPKELQERVLKEEHKLYSQVVEALCNRQIAWREDGIPYILESQPALA